MLHLKNLKKMFTESKTKLESQNQNTITQDTETYWNYKKLEHENGLKF